MGRILVIINLVLLNLGLGWLFYKSQIPVVAPTSTNSIEYVDQCGEECKKYIDSNNFSWKNEKSLPKKIKPLTI